jgi:hypothetical protein
MFYGKDSIETQFAPLLEKLKEPELVFFEPMPSYKEDKVGTKWCDEFRIRDGHTKLADGSWVTIRKVTTYVEALQKSTTELYDCYLKSTRDLTMALQQKREMEYGLRSAQKSLLNAINMKESNNE